MQSFMARRWVWISGALALVVLLLALILTTFTTSNSKPVETGANQATLTPGANPVQTGANSAGEEYLALGDSVAFGVGASPPQALGYPAVFYRQYLKPVKPNIITYKNLAIAGETTTSFISRPKSQSQLEKALAELDAAQKAGQPVSLITLTIGGNDLLAARNKSPAAKQAVLDETASNLQNILSQLQNHTASGKTDIIVTTYYNPYPTGTPEAKEDGAWLERFNDLLKKRAAELKIKVADFFAPVVGRETNLTWIAGGDIHPNSAGHAALALAVWQATGYAAAKTANHS
jgi:lysophospholipase L1-like esterase